MHFNKCPKPDSKSSRQRPPSIVSSRGRLREYILALSEFPRWSLTRASTIPYSAVTRGIRSTTQRASDICTYKVDASHFSEDVAMRGLKKLYTINQRKFNKYVTQCVYRAKGWFECFVFEFLLFHFRVFAVLRFRVLVLHFRVLVVLCFPARF